MYIIYGKDDCQFCDKAKQLLDNEGIEYKYLKLDTDFSRDQLLNMFPKAKTFPQITNHMHDYIGGYTELNSLIERRTYIKHLLSDAIVKVTFKKVNGDTREILCTTSSKYIPERDSTPVTTSKPNKELINVWDTEAQDWRSFRVDRVISYGLN